MICEEKFSRERFDKKKMQPQNQQFKKNQRNSNLQRLAYLKKVCTSRSYCWFARDVTAAMLVVKNKSISLLWELNSIFMSILRGNILLF